MKSEMTMDNLIDALRNAKCIGCLTGAGISTLCGIPDFRGPNGLYRQPDAERIFDIDWFDRDPTIYYRGCADLVYGLDRFQPGPVHLALKHLEGIGLLKGIATQNIDMLHQKAGSSHVYEVHGSPIRHHCRRCGNEKSFSEIVSMLDELKSRFPDDAAAQVPRCACGGVYKPDITFFGEMLPEAAFVSSQELAAQSDVFLVLGTSLTVFPAADIPRCALRSGARIFIVNAQETSLDNYAEAVFRDLGAFAKAVLAL